MEMRKVRKYMVLVARKYLAVFIFLVGVPVYSLGAVVSWHGLAVAGLVLSSFGIFVGIGRVLSLELNPLVAMGLNFFVPGLGFVHCRRWYFYLVGAVLFIASLSPQFPFLTIPGIVATAIANLSALTLQTVFLALCLNSLLAVLAYFAAKYVKKSEGGGGTLSISMLIKRSEKEAKT